jgi:hypothetical protein
MTQLIVQYNPDARSGSCGLCGEPTSLPAGSQILVAESEQPVCPGCGKRHAPSLVALVQLANEAERVGRISRHTVFPPYTALLDLARAADNYSSSVAPPATPPLPPPARHDN